MCISFYWGAPIGYVEQMRYLGVWFVSGRKFTVDFSPAKKKFARVVNAIFAKTGTRASESVVLHLIRAQALPCLLYGCEALDPNRSVCHSLDFLFYRFIFKLFRTNSRVLVDEVLLRCGVAIPSVEIGCRRSRFLHRRNCQQVQ